MSQIGEKENYKVYLSKCIDSFISDDLGELIEKNKTVVEYSPGQVIFKQSSFASKIIYVVSGYIKIIKEGSHGKSSFIKVVEPGDFLSIPIHENQQKYPFTAVALTEVNVCEIQESIIHNNISKNPRLFAFLNDQYYDAQDFLMKKLLVIATHNSHGKLASAILYFNCFNKIDFSIFDYLTRRDLADFSCISLESTNKILQELNNDKIISVDRKGLRVDKLVLLEKLSQLG
jgi:CRP/FNR family transcriptional regulator, polysaccharide utilization system transcription regulator